MNAAKEAPPVDGEEVSPEVKSYREASRELTHKRDILEQCANSVEMANQELILAQANHIKALRDVKLAERLVSELWEKARRTAKFVNDLPFLDLESP